MRTNVNFQIETVPADGVSHFSYKRRPRNVATFGQHLVKLINSTVCQRTILVARRAANSHPATRLHRHDVGVMIDNPFPLYLLQCGRRVMMLWTAPPPAHECHERWVL
jgi:hypothetical protein